MFQKKILVVDDDNSLRQILTEALENNGYDVVAARDGASGLKAIEEQTFDLVITDLAMPEMNGIELLEAGMKVQPDLGFLIVTAYGTVETAVDALQKGAFDFITKPFSLTQIKSRIDRYFKYEGLVVENKNLKEKINYENKYSKMVGTSPQMSQVYHQIDIVAKSDAPVFIQGESGTGKELIAQAIHNSSERKNNPFLKVNCSAIPETLFESTLFGHEKGSFTNAIRQHVGLFEEANTGTLLLDEISETPISMQAKLLRVLQEGKITRVGSTQEISVDVRVIATSNRKIGKLIEEKKFRSDLYYRLNVFPILVPALRERPEDIPVLLNYFIKKFVEKYKSEDKKLTPETLKALSKQPWHGNVRQLENLTERAVLYSGINSDLDLDYFSLESDAFGEDATFSPAEAQTIAEMEKRLIYSTLKKTKDNRTRAAGLLDISVRTLRNKLNLYDSEKR